MKQPCKTKYCRRTARKGYKICTTCDKRNWRKKYPMKAAFQTLRQNARRRGKEFTLTYEEFEAFCYAFDYITGKGRKAKSYTVDRIDNEKGYTRDNIQVLTKSENVKKYLSYDWQTRTAVVW